jgi:hypothetical protein
MSLFEVFMNNFRLRQLCTAGLQTELAQLCETTPDLDINSTTFIQVHPLILAISNGHLSILRYFVEEAPKYLTQPLKFSDLGWNLYTQAIESKQLKILRYLIEDAPHFNQPRILADGLGSHLLWLASKNGCLPIVKYCIEELPKHTLGTLSLQKTSSLLSTLHSSPIQVPILKYLVLVAPNYLQQMLDITSLSKEMLSHLSRTEPVFVTQLEMIQKNWELLDTLQFQNLEWFLARELEATSTTSSSRF